MAAGDLIIIPINTNYYSQKVGIPLDGSVYRFKFDYNQRADIWTVCLMTDNETPIFMGRKLLPSRNPFFGYVSTLAPKGRFVVLENGKLIYECTE